MSMAKKITLRNQEYPKKLLRQFILNQDKALFLKAKEVVGFSCGVAMVETEKGRKFYHVGGTDMSELNFIFYNGKVEEQRLMFRESSLSEMWKSVLLYFFDGDGALLFLANRKHLNESGAFFWNSGAVGMQDVEQLARNIMCHIDEKLLDLLWQQQFSVKDRVNLMGVDKI